MNQVIQFSQIEGVMRQRRTIHIFNEEQIEVEILLQGLECALLAPNHKHTFPWSFVIVGKKTREAILKAQLSQADLDEKKLRMKLIHPAGLIAFCCKRSSEPVTAREDYASVACGIQNFTLAMAAKGYQCKWSTGALTRQSSSYEILGIDEKQTEIVGFVWVGTSRLKPNEQKRPALKEVLKILD